MASWKAQEVLQTRWGWGQAPSWGAHCGCHCWDGCGWAQIQGGDLVWVVLTILVLWEVPPSTVVNGHIFFFYEIYSKDWRANLKILSCFNFVVLPNFVSLSWGFYRAHINQMLQSLIWFLPVPVNDVVYKSCARYLAIYVNTFLYFCWNGYLRLLQTW